MIFRIYSDVEANFDNLLASSKLKLEHQKQKLDDAQPVTMITDDIDELFVENKQVPTE